MLIFKLNTSNIFKKIYSGRTPNTLNMKIKHLYISLFILAMLSFPSNQLFASKKSDSLEILIQRMKHENKFDSITLYSYKDLIYETINFNPIKALNFAFELLDFANKVDNNNAKQNAYHLIGVVYFGQGNYSKAYENYSKCLELNKQAERWGAMAYSLSDIGNINFAAKQLDQATKNYEEALAIIKKHQNYVKDYQTIRTILYNNLGITNRRNGNLSKALAYHDSAYTIAKEKNDLIQIPTSLLYQSVAFFDFKHYDKAESLAAETVKFAKKNKSKYNLGNALNTLGKAQFSQKKYREAKTSLLEAYLYCTSLGMTQTRIQNLQYRALISEVSGEFELAIELATKAIELSELHQYKIENVELAEFLGRIHEQKGDLSKALKYYKIYHSYSEEYISQNMQTKMAEEKFKIELKNRDTKIKYFEKEKQLNNYLRLLFVFIGVLVGLLALIFFVRYREKKLLSDELKLREATLEKLIDSKTKLFSIISHDLRGPVGGMQNIIDLMLSAYDEMDKEEIYESLELMGKSNKNIHNLLENLLLWANTSNENRFALEIRELELKQFVLESLEYIATTTELKNISLANNVPAHLFVIADSNSLSLIFRNLLSNAAKFTPKGGSITINSKILAEEIEICIADTGMGMNQSKIETLFELGKNKSYPGTENEIGTGLGLILVKEYVELNNGRIEVESEEGKGTKFKLFLPKKSFEFNKI